MDQIFAIELEEAGNNKAKLLQLLKHLDSEKSSAKSYLRRVSMGLVSDNPTGKDRFALIVKLRDKISILEGQRETVRARLARIKEYRIKVKKAANQRKLGFKEAFLAAAEINLTPEQFQELELKAAEILMVLRENDLREDEA